MAITAIGMVLCTIAFLFWSQLNAEQKIVLFQIFKEDFAYLFTAAVLVFTAFGFTIDWFFRFYIIPVSQMADEVDLILSVNPELRLKPDASHDVVRLAASINRLAQQKKGVKLENDTVREQALWQIEVEKNIFATLLEDLPQGLLICNLDGRIVFFNRKIKQLVNRPPAPDDSPNMGGTEHWIGLGRSVYLFVSRDLLVNALERIEGKLAASDNAPVERFLIGLPGIDLLPAELVPVLDKKHRMNGFIILVEDFMSRHRREKELLVRLQAWRHKLIQSVSAIRATAEVLAQSPQEAVSTLKSMNQTLAKEAKTAADILKKADWMTDLTLAQPRPLTPVLGHEWGQLLHKHIREIPGLTFDLNIPSTLPEISADLHHLNLALHFMLKRIQNALGCNHFEAELFRKGNWIYLDSQWKGSLDFVAFETWKRETLTGDDADNSRSVDEILEMHGARLWVGRRRGSDETCGMLLLLPVQESLDEFQEQRRAAVLPENRPEFYDFNLFQQPGQRADLDKNALVDLSYTVFDTETTGLNPRGGDEIISIGAVRIVKGRLLHEEKFNQLVDPRRQVPWASVKYHGIHPDMLEGKPFIEEVLPRFEQFVGDTILIGHNVAFDMLMLEQKEALTNIRFEQPILDTLLLADVVHPAHKDHSLEALGKRLGVHIKDRHTALGDAAMTAEIFLKLLPLLAMHRIHTLGQARHASEKSYYARLRY